MLKIANVMLGRGKGGLEQVFLDYSKALQNAGFFSLPVISRGAALQPMLAEAGLKYHAITQWGAWDILAARRLLRIFQQEKVGAVIAHGKRALSLSLPANDRKIPVIAVAPNYNRGSYHKADAVIASTGRLRDHLIGCDVNSKRIFVVPNATNVAMPRATPAPFHNPPVIGAIGRMVRKKGFDVLCDALAILKSRNTRFRAVIAGDGEERGALENKVLALGLASQVTFPGWIDNDEKLRFWKEIDLFCLPSLHEPFGIVVLEAWAASRAVVTTDAEGPSEFAADQIDALIVPKGNANALAASLSRLLERPDEAATLAANGYNKVRAHYSIEALTARLTDLIGKTVRLAGQE